MTISQSTFFNLNIESFNLSATGLTGDTGLTGPRGATGVSLLGLTGNTGVSLDNIIQQQDYTLRFNYSDNQVFLSSSIRGPVGEAKISLTGQSMASFSPLRHSLTNQTVSVIRRRYKLSTLNYTDVLAGVCLDADDDEVVMVSTKCMLGELEIVDIKDCIREDHNRLQHPVLATHQARGKRKSLLKRFSSELGIRCVFIQCQHKGIITNRIGVL